MPPGGLEEPSSPPPTLSNAETPPATVHLKMSLYNELSSRASRHLGAIFNRRPHRHRHRQL